MNKNRNKVAAMMMVAAITVSSVAMPVEAAVNSVKNSNIRKEEKINSGIDNVVLDSPYFEDDNFINKITEITGIQPGNPIGNNLSAITELDIKNSNITNLKGIEYFTSLKKLNCYNNNISELDLSNSNKNLEEIDCGDNLLSEFKLPSSIQVIRCKKNSFKELNLSQYSQLKTLECGENEKLESINISQNTGLITLDASKTKIYINGGIDLKQNKVLQNLTLTDNKLDNIDVSSNTALQNLNLENNKLTDIKLEQCTGLLELDLSGNELTDIDLSGNKLLQGLKIGGNKLKSLDLTQNIALANIISSGTEGKILVSNSIQPSYYFVTEQPFDLKNNDYIDLNKEYGITQEEIKNNRVELDSDEVKLNGVYFDGTKIKWKGKTPDLISYKYKCGGKRDEVKLSVFLHLENNNTEQGGDSGGGTTTPDQKPDQKPDEKPNKPGNITSKIVGKNRYETAAKIADELVKNNVSYNSVILVNSDKSMADGLSAASLSGKKNAPILLVKKDSIPAEAMAKIEKAKNVYIIGGEGAISKKVENQLKGKNITRISGKDRYETSAKIANMLGGYKMAFIVNGAKGEADAMSVSSVAAKYGAPILLTNGKTSTHPVKAGVSYFVIGGRGVVSNQLADKYNADRIAGVDRYSTNRKVIDEFYYDSKKVYFAKGDTLVDALTASLLAKDNGMVLVSKNANHKKLEGKEAVQVGGMDFEISFE